MSLFSFFKKPQPSVAFSFDSGYVRWVVAIREGDHIQVSEYGSEFLGPVVMDEFGTIIDDALFVKKIRTLNQADKGEPKYAEANIVIPDHQAILFHTHVAKMENKEMGDIIMDHIKTYCEAHDLLELKDYICEYDVILATDFGYDVHVTLVPKLYSNHLARLFKQAGINVRHIETAHHAVAKACLDIPHGMGYALVSMGKKTTGVAIIHGEHAVSRSVVPVGTDNLVQVIGGFLGSSKEESLRIIARHGILQTHPDNGLLGELHLELGPIWREIDQQLIRIGQMPYKTFGHRFIVDAMVVYGEGVTSVKGLAGFLGERTSLRASELDVWASRSGQRSPIMNMPADETLVYAEALSLAITYLG